MATIEGSAVKKVVVACDAGMGSSVLLTTQLKKTLAPYDVTVEHAPVDRVPADADLVLCHAGLVGRARTRVPETVVIGFQMFLGDPVFTKVEAAIRDGGTLGD